MTEPKRYVRERSKGWRKPEGALDCCRPGPPSNPFGVEGKVKPDYPHPVFLTAQEATGAFIDWLAGTAHQDVEPARREKILLLLGTGALRGRDLMCWCSEDEPCHATALLKLANRPRPALRVTPPTLSPNLLRRS